MTMIDGMSGEIVCETAQPANRGALENELRKNSQNPILDALNVADPSEGFMIGSPMMHIGPVLMSPLAVKHGELIKQAEKLSAMTERVRLNNEQTGRMLEMAKASFESTHNEAPIPFPIVKNPAVSTNELLKQLIEQTATQNREHAEQMNSLTQCLALVVDGIKVISADIQTLIHRVSFEAPGDHLDETGTT